MGNYKLWELANNSREEVYALAQQVVDELVSEETHQLNSKDWDEPTQALVYSAHYVMWNSPKKVNDLSRPPYTHKVEMRVIDALRKAVPGYNKLMGEGSEPYQMSRSVYSILSNNQLVMRVGGSGAKTHYLREWPKGFVPRWFAPQEATFMSQRDRYDADRQDRRAEKLAGPIVVTYDLDSIPLPEPTPEAILGYVRKVMAAAKALQVENSELRKKLEHLEQSGAWENVVDEISHLMSND